MRSEGLLIVFSLACFISPALAQEDRSALPDELQKTLRDLPADTKVGLAVLDAMGRIVIEYRAQTDFSAASSIKTALLWELFSAYGNQLDQGGRDDIRDVVGDPNHPAISHFPTDVQKTIARDLENVDLQNLGSILINFRDLSGRRYSNATYNAASNIAISLLGGPKAVTRRFHAQGANSKQLNLRRYMLTNRVTNGDNTATPLALASIFHHLIGEQPSNLNKKASRAIKNILHVRDDPQGGRLYAKGGSLTSNPATSVRSGRYELNGLVLNYAIMAERKMLPGTDGQKQYDQLSELTLKIYQSLKRDALAK